MREPVLVSPTAMTRLRGAGAPSDDAVGAVFCATVLCAAAGAAASAARRTGTRAGDIGFLNMCVSVVVGSVADVQSVFLLISRQSGA